MQSGHQIIPNHSFMEKVTTVSCIWEVFLKEIFGFNAYFGIIYSILCDCIYIYNIYRDMKLEDIDALKYMHNYMFYKVI